MAVTNRVFSEFKSSHYLVLLVMRAHGAYPHVLEDLWHGLGLSLERAWITGSRKVWTQTIRLSRGFIPVVPAPQKKKKKAQKRPELEL